MNRAHNQAIDWSKISIEDLFRNPKRFGLPTLEEYRKGRGKWHPGSDGEQAMVSITDGPQQFRKDLQKIIFKVHGAEMNQEQVERALGDHGFSLADIDMENRNSRLKKTIQMIPQGGGKYDIEVNFLP